VSAHAKTGSQAGHLGATAAPNIVRRLRASRHAQAVLVLTVLAAALRFGTLNVQSVWLDESATIVLVRHSLGGMFSHLSSSESTPPLYYTLVWLWTKVFSTGVIGFRSFSALIGTLTIPVMYLAGRQCSPRVGLWAALLTTVNPAMYYYSQETRAYVLLILFSAAALLFWLRVLETGERRDLGWWAAMSVVSLLTHYFAIFLILPEAVVLIRRLGIRRLRLPVGAIILTGAALLPLAISQRQSGQSKWIEESSFLSRAAEAPKQFLVGLYGPQEILTAALAGVLVLGAVALIVYHGHERERRFALRVAIVAAAGMLVPLVLAFTHIFDIFDGRNVIAAWVPCALVVAAGLGATDAQRAGIAVGAGICLMSVLVILGIDTQPAYQRDDWRGVAHGLHAPSSGSIVVTEANSLLPLSIYVPTLRKTDAKSVAAQEIEFVALRVRHTGRAPSAATVPTGPLTHFRLAGIKRTETYAISRFVAPYTVSTKASELRRLISEKGSEILVSGEAGSDTG
jgi:Dolichyl-phosphate-mannose-protein mannosyltransferase